MAADRIASVRQVDEGADTGCVTDLSWANFLTIRGYRERSFPYVRSPAARDLIAHVPRTLTLKERHAMVQETSGPLGMSRGLGRGGGARARDDGGYRPGIGDGLDLNNAGLRTLLGLLLDVVVVSW
jgi:hypothetical protein